MHSRSASARRNLYDWTRTSGTFNEQRQGWGVEFTRFLVPECCLRFANFANYIANLRLFARVLKNSATKRENFLFWMWEGPVLFMAQMKPAWLLRSMGTWVPAPLRMSRSCSFIPCTFTECIHRSQHVQPQCPLQDVSVMEARTF